MYPIYTISEIVRGILHSLGSTQEVRREYAESTQRVRREYAGSMQEVRRKYGGIVCRDITLKI